ncbi:hypothetical protein BV378_34180 [Nostoc sp. RF31YmG]|nr:hypothetical protein BV378_34180 [Nostoc sp. RF31YmG]
MILAPYSFVLGVELPRKDDIKLVKDSISCREEWRVQKTVLPLHVIHICINLQELTRTAQNWRIAIRFLKNIFKKRSNYSDNWACKGKIKAEKLGVFFLRRLLVNGFAIEVYGIRQEVVEHIQGYELTKLAGVDIRTVNQASLAVLKHQCLLNVVGIHLSSDNEISSYKELCQRSIKRLSPYKEDLVKVVFNEDIDKSKLTRLPIESNKTEETDTRFSVRLANLATKKEYLKALLTERGFDLNCYEVNKYLEKIPKDNNYVDSNHDTKMTVYVKSFTYKDLRLPGHYSSTIYGSKGVVNQSHNILHCQYEEVYLAVQVDRAFWLLLEVYLSDFTKVKLNEDEGYLKKQYVSARKTLRPSMLTVSLNGKWKADIPFGPKNNMSYYEVKEMIESRLQTSGIPKLNCSFKFM